MWEINVYSCKLLEFEVLFYATKPYYYSTNKYQKEAQEKNLECWEIVCRRSYVEDKYVWRSHVEDKFTVAQEPNQKAFERPYNCVSASFFRQRKQ